MARIARVATFLREENVNTYLQGRKIASPQDYERPSMEALRLIRKLRWIGMEEEAERVETQLHETTLAGGVVTAAHETDRSTVQKLASTDGHACSQWFRRRCCGERVGQRTGS